MEPKRHSFRFQAPEAPFLRFAAPAPSIDRVPSGKQWIHEIKFDGYRVQIQIANAAAKVFTRRGRTGRTEKDRQQPSRPCAFQFGDCQCSHTRSAPLKTIGDTPKAIAPQNTTSLKTSRLRCMAVPFHPRRVGLVKD
jgi:hypothetical protein